MLNKLEYQKRKQLGICMNCKNKVTKGVTFFNTIKEILDYRVRIS